MGVFKNRTDEGLGKTCSTGLLGMSYQELFRMSHGTSLLIPPTLPTLTFIWDDTIFSPVWVLKFLHSPQIPIGYYQFYRNACYSMLPLVGRPHHCFPIPSPHTTTSHSVTITSCQGSPLAFSWTLRRDHCGSLHLHHMETVCPAMKSIALSVCSTKHLRKPLKSVLHFYSPLGNQTVILILLILTVMYVCANFLKSSCIRNRGPLIFRLFFIPSHPSWCTRFKTLFSGGPGKWF